MLRADYHFHTDASYDSRATPEAILERAIRSGVGLLCVTDHDTIEGAARLAAVRCREVRVVVGCEFTAEDGTHVIGLGLGDMIEEKRILPLLERIKLQGGTVLMPHPFRRGSGIFRNEARRPEAFVRDVLARTDLVECFNGRDTWANNERNRGFAAGRGLAAVAGSDAHRAAEVGSVFVEYEGDEPVHGVSPRAIWFPARPPSSENPLKRRAMELYHRHERRLPPAIRRGYRQLRGLLKRDAPRWADAEPRRQYELPLPVEPSVPEAAGGALAGGALDEAGDRRARVGGAPRAPLAPAPRDRDRGPGDVPG